MSETQRRIWLLAAYLCIALTVVGTFSLFATIRLGLTAEYFEKASLGDAPALFTVETPLDYAKTALVLMTFFGLRFIFATLVITCLRLALVPPQYTIFHQLLSLSINGMVVMALLITTNLLYGQLYATDVNRAEYMGVIRVLMFLYIQMSVISASGTVAAAIYAGTLPRAVGAGVFFMFAVPPFILSLMGLYPHNTLVLGVMPILAGTVILGSYMLLVYHAEAAQRQNNSTNPTLSNQ